MGAVQRAGCDDYGFCIAVCPSQAKWAVGIASKGKFREQAARLSLCLALAANIEDFSNLAARNPEFTAFCELSGIATDVPITGGLQTLAPAAPAKKQKAAAQAPTIVDTTHSYPKDTPMWIVLE